MEVLAVVLILAVVIMFAIPGIRAIRNEIYYQQAKAASVKMADAMRSYYQNTKGYRIQGTLVGKLPPATEATGLTSVIDAAQVPCNEVSTGIPTYSTGVATMDQLFACDYLSAKDFSGLPYRFEADDTWYAGNVLVRSIGFNAAGTHAGKGWCVYRDSSVTETLNGTCRPRN